MNIIRTATSSGNNPPDPMFCQTQSRGSDDISLDCFAADSSDPLILGSSHSTQYHSIMRLYGQLDIRKSTLHLEQHCGQSCFLNIRASQSLCKSIDAGSSRSLVCSENEGRSGYRRLRYEAGLNRIRQCAKSS